MTSPRDNKKASAERILKSILCPHCWYKFQPRDIVWVSRHKELRGDPVLGADKNTRFLPTRFDVAGNAIDAMGEPCPQMACPRCHLSIPRELLRFPAMLFSLIGGPYSGKSFFLASMAWELSRLLPETFNMMFRSVGNDGSATLSAYQKQLFMPDDSSRYAHIEKTKPDSATHYNTTNLKGQCVMLPSPFMFTLTPTVDHSNAQESEVYSRVLCLYDNAGEHFLAGGDTARSPAGRHLAESKVLLFVFDPTQSPRFREQCAAVSDDPQLTTRTRTQLHEPILTEAVSRIRNYAGLRPGEKIGQPLLVLVSKSDIWNELIEGDVETEPYAKTAPHDRPCGAVDIRRIEKVSGQVRALVRDMSPDFVAAAEECCHTVTYIPFSAIGCSPTVDGRDGRLVVKPCDITAQWVTVPIMYAFSVWASGLFPTVE